MLTVTKAAIAIILFVPATTIAVQSTGSIYSVVGFSLKHRALLQHQHVQHGVTHFEVWDSNAGELLSKHSVAPDQPAEKLQAQLIQTHHIISPGYIGPLAPNRSATLIVSPSSDEQNAEFNAQIELSDGMGSQQIKRLSVQASCKTINTRHLKTQAVWAPDSSAVFLVGAIISESPCGFSNAKAIAIYARPRGPISARGLSLAGTKLRTTIRQLGGVYPSQAAFLAAQLLAIFPDEAATLTILAEQRVLSGDLGGALAALWRLPVVRQGRLALKQAFKANWVEPLKQRAQFRALKWYLQSQ